MSNSKTLKEFNEDEEYRAIESALLETARGRWFLAEHGRRARRLDSALLEDAIDKLKSSLREPPALLGKLKAELENVKEFISETRTSLVSPSGQQALNGSASAAAMSDAQSDATNGAPHATQQVNGDDTSGIILKAAEDMHQLAWTLQSDQVSIENCENIARQATRIYALSHQHAMQSEKTLQMASSLDDAGQRLLSILDTVMQELEVDQTGDGPAAELPDIVETRHAIAAGE